MVPTDREIELNVTVPLPGLNSVLQAPQVGSVTKGDPVSPEHPIYKIRQHRAYTIIPFAC